MLRVKGDDLSSRVGSVDLFAAFAVSEGRAAAVSDAAGLAGPREVGSSLYPPQNRPDTLCPDGQKRPEPSETRNDRRRRRHERRRGLRAAYQRPELGALRTVKGYLPSWAQCGHTCTTGEIGLHLAPSQAPNAPRRAYLSGLLTCKSVWACPVCSAAILGRRGLDVEHVTDWARREHGATPWLITLTVRHARADDLRKLLEGLSLAWSKLLSGTAWQRARKRIGFVGSVRRLEVTRGPNGWHPHLHLLIWATGDLTAEIDWLSKRWQAMVARHLGERHEPDPRYGLDVRPIDDAEEYVTKPIHEVTDSDTKRSEATGHESIAQLCDRVAGPDPSAADLEAWLEWCQATRGRRALTWSQGLRAAAGLVEGDDDNEADEDDTNGQVARLDGERWNALRGFPRAVCAVLEAAERGAWDDVRAAGFDVLVTQDTRAG